jgi:hypothetical protein
VPVPAADVAVVGEAADVDDDAEEDKGDHGDDFDEGKDELCFAVAFDAEEVDDHDGEQEDGGEDGAVEIAVPVADCDGCGDDFERQDDKPLHGVAGEVSQPLFAGIAQG